MGENVKNKRIIVSASCLLLCLTAGYVWQKDGHERAAHVAAHGSHHLSDAALLSLVNNDQLAFENFITMGGDLHSTLPLVEGKTLTVAEGIAHFERVGFIKYLQSKKISFIKQNKNGENDIVALAVAKNNPELLKAIMEEKPDLTIKYGEKKQNLLHIASTGCSDKIAPMLHQTGKFHADDQRKDGATPLTIAAENKCVPMLTLWKDYKADFNKKDGRGKSPMAIIKKINDAEVADFMKALATGSERKPASISPIAAAPKPEVRVQLFRKRKIPKDELADHTNMVDPEIRPLDAEETSDFSEFSD